MPRVRYRSPSIAPAYTGRLSTAPVPSPPEGHCTQSTLRTDRARGKTAGEDTVRKRARGDTRAHRPIWEKPTGPSGRI